jgi:hypothetical protein
MTEITLSVPEQLVDLLQDAARRCGVDVSEVAIRAIGHAIKQDGSAEASKLESIPPPASELDWQSARKTIREARCDYDTCPFDGICPPELCPL